MIILSLSHSRDWSYSSFCHLSKSSLGNLQTNITSLAWIHWCFSSSSTDNSVTVHCLWTEWSLCREEECKNKSDYRLLMLNFGETEDSSRGMWRLKSEEAGWNWKWILSQQCETFPLSMLRGRNSAWTRLNQLHFWCWHLNRVLLGWA